MTSRAEVRLLLQDATLTVDGAAATATEILNLPPQPPDGFLDGPACRRLAVVDFDPQTGAAQGPPVALERPAPGRVTGRYRADGELASPGSLAVNAFGTAFKTLAMFERPTGLGRPVRWAFGGEQLLVVPRAGTWANAFYERRTRSLQFFSFAARDGQTVHTALSRDIVAHEMGHALLDAVAPHLYDSLGVQGLATHEAVADLVAVLVAIDTDKLRERVLDAVGNDLAGTNAFTMIAEEFGRARAGAELPRRTALRELANSDTVADRRAAGPHALSTVLSGLLYDTLADTYASIRATLSEREPTLSTAAVANRALGSASQLVQRLLIQGLDLLPPGEAGFADVGRAMLAADRALQPGPSVLRPGRPSAATPSAAPPGAAPPSAAPPGLAPPDGERLAAHREALAGRFVARGIVPSAEALDQPVAVELSAPVGELTGLRDSDWAAYRYVDARRPLMGVPPDAHVRVLPRLDAVKQYGSRDPVTGLRPGMRQLIIKVAWDVLEDAGNPLLDGVARQRRISTGATVVLRWDDGAAVALVLGGAASDAAQRGERDSMMRRLLGEDSSGLDGPTLSVTDGVLEVSGTQTLLHLAGGGDA